MLVLADYQAAALEKGVPVASMDQGATDIQKSRAVHHAAAPISAVSAWRRPER